MSKFVQKLVTVFHFIKYRYFMNFKSRECLLKWQEKKIFSLLKIVTKRSPFYSSLVDVSYLKYPIVDKAVMMTNFNELNTRELRRDEALQLALKSERDRDFSPMINGVTIGLSSGTSGHRGLFLASAYERAKYAGIILAKALPRGRVFKKNKIALFLRANSNLYEAVGSRLIDFRFFDICKDIDSHISILNKMQPDLLIAQASVLRYLAAKQKSGELKINPIRIFSAAEVLEDFDRDFIKAAFKQNIHQIYQCTEGFVAISCEFGELHLNEDLMLIEKEVIGEADHKFQPILTDFNRITQPIIRYRLNDILTEETKACRCGSVYRRLSSIEGRHDDVVYFMSKLDGQYIHIWSDLIRARILYSGDEILEYRVHQNKDASLHIMVKTNSNYETVCQKIRTEMEALARDKKCLLPTISFSEFTLNADFTMKQRRIRSDFQALDNVRN
ncbi:MAG: hypothetical protein KDD38_02495 [Bdellovibrionales bacterium]|nr:hypothetical protein [Bdellovibrionales bacterium]